MTTLEMAKKIGTRIRRSFNGLSVEVEIVDAKVSYGQERYLVKVAGQEGGNSVWINA